MRHVKENDLAHGEFGDWAESIGFKRDHIHKFIQAYEQFGKSQTSANLTASKIFEMLSLPAEVDRQQFVEKAHIVPSTQETKKVDEMTVRELRINLHF